MPRSTLTTLAVTAALVVGAPAALADAHAEVDVIAHRGASAYAPENTLPAVELGVEMRADLVEVDVQSSSDGELVVVHDTTLARTTDVETRYPLRLPWNVGHLTAEEIRTLDAGSWKSPEFAGTRVPTLQEVLDTLRGRAGLLLEVKDPARYPGIAQDIVAELDGEGWLRADARAGRLVVQSFDWEFMREFHALAPDVPAGLLGGPPTGAELAELATWADQINPSHTRVTADVVDAVHGAGLEIHPYTVNDPIRMRELVDLGVDGIITDRPDVLVGVIAGERGQRPAA